MDLAQALREHGKEFKTCCEICGAVQDRAICDDCRKRFTWEQIKDMLEERQPPYESPWE